MEQIKYDPKYCAELIEFFTVKERYDVVVKKVTYFKDGGGKSTETMDIVAKPPPHVGAFARQVGVSKETLYKWAEKHREFAQAMTAAKQLRRELIIDQALIGHYDARFSEIAAANLIGWGREPDKANDPKNKIGKENPVHQAWDARKKEERKKKIGEENKNPIPA